MDDQVSPTHYSPSKLPTSLHTVTPLSKAIAMLVFIILPFLGLYLGMQYQKQVNTCESTVQKVTCNKKIIPTVSPSPTLEVPNMEHIGNLQPEHVYKEPNINIIPTEGYVITTSRLSNDINKIAYAEISDGCLFDTTTNNENCSFTFNLFIKNIAQNKRKLVYSKKYTIESGDYMVYFPMGWSKNDKKLLLQYGNPTLVGRGGGPVYWWATLNVSTNKIENLSSNRPEFIDNKLYAIFTDNSSKSPALCGPGFNYGNSGRIVKKNIETGKIVTLLEQPNTYYAELLVEGISLSYEMAPVIISDTYQKCGDYNETKPLEKIILSL